MREVGDSRREKMRKRMKGRWMAPRAVSSPVTAIRCSQLRDKEEEEEEEELVTDTRPFKNLVHISSNYNMCGRISNHTHDHGQTDRFQFP